MSVSRALPLVPFALAVVAAVTLPTRAQDAESLPWVVFVRVVDTTRAGLEAKVTDTLKQAILKAEVNVVPSEDLEAAARKRGVPRKRWAEEGALTVVAADVGADFLVFAKLTSSSRYTYDVELYAIDAKSGANVASQRIQVAGDLKKASGGPSGAEVDALVQRLIAALPKPSAPTAPVETPDAGPGVVVEAPVDGGPPPNESASWDTGWDESSSSTAESGVSQILRELQAELGGRIGADTFAYPNDLFYEPLFLGGIEKVRSRQQVDLALRASVGGKAASGNATLLIRKDFADVTRDRFEAEEAYADVDIAGVRLRGGRSYITWGTVDLQSPTDVLSPFDYRDLLDVEKRPTWNVRMSWGIGPLTLEGYYMPLVEPHILPQIESIADDGRVAGSNRWVKGVSGVDPNDSPVPLRFKLALNNIPPPAIESGQLAVRARLSLGGVDASLGYGFLYDPFPAVIVKAVAAKPLPLFADVTFEDRLLRRHVITADFETAPDLGVGKLRFSGETLVALLEAAEDGFDVAAECKGTDECELVVEESYITVAAGVDYETARFLEGSPIGDQAVRVFFQLLGTIELHEDGNDIVPRIPDFQDPIARLRHPLPAAVLTRFEYLFGDTTRLELTFVDNLLRLDPDDETQLLFTNDILIIPAVQALFADVVTGRLEAAFLLGDTEETTFGRYPENLRVGASLGVSF